MGLGVCALALGGVTALVGQKGAIETKADDPIEIASGAKIYLDLGTSNWGADGAKILFWNTNANGGAGKFYEFTKDDPSDPYYYVQLDAACSKFDLVRNNAVSWTDKWNQSADSYFYEYCNLIKATGYEADTMTFTWDAYDNGYEETALSSDVVYGWAQRSFYTYYVYTWETFTVDGITLRSEPNGAWPGTAASVTSKTVYNPAEKTSETSTYGVVKFQYSYRVSANLHVKLYFDAGDWNKQSKTMTLSPTGDEIQLSPKAYYYNTNDYELWDLTANANMGHDAAIAYDLDKADICNLSEDNADDLRDEMDSNKGFVTGATWAGYSYEAAYNLVDSQCTTPKSSAKTTGFVTETANHTVPLVAILLVTIVSLGAGVYLAKKRRAE